MPIDTSHHYFSADSNFRTNHAVVHRGSSSLSYGKRSRIAWIFFLPFVSFLPQSPCPLFPCVGTIVIGPNNEYLWRISTTLLYNYVTLECPSTLCKSLPTNDKKTKAFRRRRCLRIKNCNGSSPATIINKTNAFAAFLLDFLCGAVWGHRIDEVFPPRCCHLVQSTQETNPKMKFLGTIFIVPFLTIAPARRF